MLREECPGRVGDLGQAAFSHLEDADFLGRSEAVLGRSNQAQGGEPLPFDREDGVDQVLERLRARQRAILRHVPDQNDGDPLPLREVHQPEGGLSHLADATRRAVEVIDGRGLDGVDDDQSRPLGTGDLHDPADLGLSHDPDPLGRGTIEEAEPGSSQADLGRRFLAGSVEDRSAAGARDPGRDVEKERRLADPGLAADEDERPADKPASEDPIQFADPDRLTRDGVLVNSPQGDGFVKRPRSGHGGRGLASDRLVNDRLDQAVPGATRATLTLPAEEGFGAGLADESALGPASDASHASAGRATPLSRPRPG